MKRPPRGVLSAALLYVELFDWAIFPVPGNEAILQVGEIQRRPSVGREQ